MIFRYFRRFWWTRYSCIRLTSFSGSTVPSDFEGAAGVATSSSGALVLSGFSIASGVAASPAGVAVSSGTSASSGFCIASDSSAGLTISSSASLPSGVLGDFGPADIA